MAIITMRESPCPFCGGVDFRVTDESVLEELYARKGSGSMQLQCKTPGCGCVMYQHQKELPLEVRGYGERLKLLEAKWKTRV